MPKSDKYVGDGLISIMRVQSSRDDDYISIEVEDDSSGVRFLEIKLSMHGFAKIITGLSSQNCEITTMRLNLLGSIAENKTEIIPRLKGDARDDKAVAKHLKIYEINGWTARRSDVSNPHRWVGKDEVTVVFFRNVDAKTGEPIT